jgi:putative permease
VLKVLKGWVDRYLSDPEAIVLVLLLVCAYFILKAFSPILIPIFISIAIAMLLQFWINLSVKHGCRPVLAFWGGYLVFITIFLAAFLFLFPLLWRQCANLLAELPNIMQNGKTALADLIHTKQSYVSEEYIQSILDSIVVESQDWGRRAISVSIATIPGIISWIVYLILVPMLVFFFLRDHVKISRWLKGFLPEKRGLIRKIWFEMHAQVGNYFRGKLTEIVIVGLFTYAVFWFFDLRYQVLLSVLVGLSVVIPFVGVVIATIPVLLVGYFQYGFAGGVTGEFALMTYSYAFVQLVDGSILVPLLFSEAVNLHPIAIIIAILFFGSIWGFWGVFFAIPLATLVKALINAWPQNHRHHHHS